MSCALSISQHSSHCVSVTPHRHGTVWPSGENSQAECGVQKGWERWRERRESIARRVGAGRRRGRDTGLGMGLNEFSTGWVDVQLTA